ncbi:MAG: hypothetical protein HGA82_03610, partial [Anaerolineales bacterium]|nr:hypothetical protein [Anaerolineales bacterium]
PELRPALVCDDVKDLELASFRAVGNAENELVRLKDTHGAYIHGCRPLGECARFLEIQGTASHDILVLSNDLRKSSQSVVVSGGARRSAILVE